MVKKKIVINDHSIEVDLLDLQDEEVHFELAGERYKFNLQAENCGKIYLKDQNGQNGEVFGFKFPLKSGETSKKWHYISGGRDLFFELEGRGKKKKKSDQEGHMLSPMPGQVIKVLVKEGQEVEKNELYLQDLGYYSLSNFKAIHKKDAYFISKIAVSSMGFAAWGDEYVTSPSLARLVETYPDVFAPRCGVQSEGTSDVDHSRISSDLSLRSRFSRFLKIVLC